MSECDLMSLEMATLQCGTFVVGSSEVSSVYKVPSFIRMYGNLLGECMDSNQKIMLSSNFGRLRLKELHFDSIFRK